MRQRASIRRKTEPPRGVLRAGPVGAHLTRHLRYHPSSDLDPYVEHYWSVAWDFRGVEPGTVEVLSHPSAHLVFERRRGGRITGVPRRKFTRQLAGAGSVFGVKFRPGGFYPFLGAPLSSLTDTTVPIEDVFGEHGRALAGRMRSARTDARRIRLVEAFLRSRSAPVDPRAVEVAQLVYAASEHRDILKVEDLAARSGLTIRALQRLFARYVGVSPKWVIQRYRLHEAAAQLASADGVSQADLAASLGYSDQAHFVRDFKAMVGTPPARYAQRAVIRPA